MLFESLRGNAHHAAAHKVGKRSVNNSLHANNNQLVSSNQPVNSSPLASRADAVAVGGEVAAVVVAAAAPAAVIDNFNEHTI